MAVSHTPVRTIDSAGNAVEESPTYTIAYSDHDEPATNVFERYIKINPALRHRRESESEGGSVGFENIIARSTTPQAGPSPVFAGFIMWNESRAVEPTTPGSCGCQCTSLMSDCPWWTK